MSVIYINLDIWDASCKCLVTYLQKTLCDSTETHQGKPTLGSDKAKLVFLLVPWKWSNYVNRKPTAKRLLYLWTWRNSYLELENFERGVNVNTHIPAPVPLSLAFAVEVVKKNPTEMKQGPSSGKRQASKRQETETPVGTAHHQERQITKRHKWNTVLLHRAFAESVPLLAGEWESRISQSDFSKRVALWRWERCAEEIGYF